MAHHKPNYVLIKDYLKTQTFSQPSEELKQVKSDYKTLWTENCDLEERYIELYDDYQSLIVDKMLLEKQFQPNWDDAPEWANWLAQDSSGAWYWHESRLQPYLDGEHRQNIKTENRRFEKASQSEEWEKSLQQRPKPPALAVEVGQVWRCIDGKKSDSDYCIKSLGSVKVNEEWKDSVTYLKSLVEPNSRQFTRTLEDFLDKFERVGGE
jgi:hypothetical protein